MSNETVEIPQDRQHTLSDCCETAAKSFSAKRSAKGCVYIIEESMPRAQGQAVIGQQPGPIVEEQAQNRDAASTAREKPTATARAELPPAAPSPIGVISAQKPDAMTRERHTPPTNAPAGPATAPADATTGSESSSASPDEQGRETSAILRMNYEDHPITSGLPLMEPNDLNKLAERIKSEGLKEEITLFQGRILDGRNRYRACKAAGVTPKFKEFEKEHPDKNPWDFVWDRNLSRLHLSQGQRAMTRLYLEKGVARWQEKQAEQTEAANKARSKAAKGNRNAAKDRPKNSRSSRGTATDSGENKTRKARAQRAAVSAATMAKCETLKKHAPDLAEQVLAGKMGLAKAYKELRRRQKEGKMRRDKEQAQQQDFKSRFDIRHCSMQELFASGIKPDLCVTTPPCVEKHLHPYGELAKCCADANVPLVAVMCGQSYLPEVLSLMTPHLKYRWTMAYLTPGGQAVRLWGRLVNTFWKPVLIFGKSNNEIAGDVVKSAVNDSDKDWHEWGQSTRGMVDLIGRLIGNADAAKLLVCDPFLGGGTTAVACMELGTKFVGCDIDQKNVKNTHLQPG